MLLVILYTRSSQQTQRLIITDLAFSCRVVSTSCEFIQPAQQMSNYSTSHKVASGGLNNLGSSDRPCNPVIDPFSAVSSAATHA